MDIFKKVRKDPDASRTFTIDWANGGPNDGTADDKGYLQGDTLSASSWVVPTGITSVVEANTTTTASIKLSGGSLGKKYLVTNRVTLAISGDVDDRTLEVSIGQK